MIVKAREKKNAPINSKKPEMQGIHLPMFVFFLCLLSKLSITPSFTTSEEFALIDDATSADKARNKTDISSAGILSFIKKSISNQFKVASNVSEDFESQEFKAILVRQANV